MDKRILIGGAAVFVVIILIFSMKKSTPVDIASDEDITGTQLYNQASDLKQEGEIVKAKETYQKILTEHPDFGDVERVQNELEDLNMKIIFSNTSVPGKTIVHEVKSGDTLGELAKKYGTTIDLIKKSKIVLFGSGPDRKKIRTARTNQKLRLLIGRQRSNHS